MSMEVHVPGKGRVVGDEITKDVAQVSTCALCESAELPTASIGGVMVCPDCLRARLEAISVARYRLREGPSQGLPWGKLTS